MKYIPCPRCNGDAGSRVIYGIHVVQCKTLECGAVLTAPTATEAAAKWNSRSDELSYTCCPHCNTDRPMEPFTLSFVITTHGYKCPNCGCSTGGRTQQQAIEIQSRRAL